MSRCSMCKQKLRAAADPPDPLGPHVLERSPIDREMCLGCWSATLEVEKWMIRATGGQLTFWSVQVHRLMGDMLTKLRAGDYSMQAIMKEPALFAAPSDEDPH